VFTEAAEEGGDGKGKRGKGKKQEEATALGRAARQKIDPGIKDNRRMGVLDPLKIAALSLKAQKEEDHSRLKIELEEQFAKLLLSLKTKLLKKAQIANKRMETMVTVQSEYDDEIAAQTAARNKELTTVLDEIKTT